MNPIRRMGSIAVAALIGLGGTTTAAGASPTRSDDDRILDIERRSLDIERRVVPFDGRSERAEGTDVTVSLDADVLFEFDQADLSPAARATLNELSDELENNLDGDTITIVGHTDSKGDAAYNQKLSERRAQTVRDALAASLSDPPTFEVEGRGASEPVADNELADGADNPEGRRRNRRVVITYTAKPPE